MTDTFGRQLRELRARLVPATDGDVECSICAGEICRACFGCVCTPCDCEDKNSAWVE